MPNELLFAALILWLLGAIIAISVPSALSRWLIALGCLSALIAVAWALPHGTAAVRLPVGIAGGGTVFFLNGSACWLAFFGFIPAALAAFGGTYAPRAERKWCFGLSVSLIGAVGVFGVHDAVSFLVAWELMSLGGALMILGERMSKDAGQATLFMLALLEVGAICLTAALLILGNASGTIDFAAFQKSGDGLTAGMRFFVGMLLLFGFGAKLGLMPFYEWFPGAYGAASGATGVVLSGVILNAAYFGLARGMTEWLPAHPDTVFPFLGAIVIGLAVVSSVLAALYAFQQENWRDLLSLSSAENACIAIALLGASLIFMHESLPDLGALAWLVALLHLAGHSLGKGAMFLAADRVREATGDYRIRQSAMLRSAAWPLGVGALLATLSLAAMPPQAGFVSEWYLFQALFQGFHLQELGGRLVLALSGAGLAVTAAVALATFVKVMGVGLLGREQAGLQMKSRPAGISVLILGIAVVVLAIGMPWWLKALSDAASVGMTHDAASRMRDDWLLVPLTAKFAFISPSKLIFALPALALIPVILLLVSPRAKARRAPVWYGGREHDPARASTTALSFSNAMRTFYSFVYRPQATTTRELASNGNGRPYFVRRLVFTHDVAPIFGPALFGPLTRLVLWIADRLRRLQSGHLNFYLALIGALLVAILAVALF